MESYKTAGSDLLVVDGGKLSFETKLTASVSLVLFYPITLCVFLWKKPSVQYWFGNGLLVTSIVISAWILICYALLAVKVLRRHTLGVVAMLILPSLMLAGMSQTHVLYFAQTSAQLLADDCTSFLEKASLERSRQVAHDFFEKCTQTLVDDTGASRDEVLMTARIDGCKGYDELEETHRREWRYLARLEDEQQCGGWCSLQQPIWAPDRGEKVRDSCSLTAARNVAGPIQRIGKQILVYSSALLLFISLGLLFAPELLGTGSKA